MSGAPSNVSRMRWTASTIQNAMLCPKPKGALRRFHEGVAARGEPIGRLLAHILEHADIINDGRRLPRESAMSDHSGAWLLTPLPSDLLDQLLMLGAEQADLEPDPDFEPDQDGEPSLGANEAMSQAGAWANTGDCLAPDLEDDQIDEGGEDDEPSARDLPVFEASDHYAHPVLGRFARL